MARTATAPTTTPDEDATLLAIARTHLRLETLDERRSNALDFHDHGVLDIRAALRAAFAAGKRAARRPGAKPAAERALPGGIALTRVEDSGWAHGRVGAFRFTAKVYGEHATVASYEIGRSRISKLELRRLDTDAVAYHWDRGLDNPAADADAQQALDLLCEHLANAVYGPA